MPHRVPPGAVRVKSIYYIILYYIILFIADHFHLSHYPIYTITDISFVSILVSVCVRVLYTVIVDMMAGLTKITVYITEPSQ